MEAQGRKLEVILLELGDLWFLCGRTKITVAEVSKSSTMKTIHRSMTREWAQANAAHRGMTLTDVEDLERAGLVDVDWGYSNTRGRRGELRLTDVGERYVRARRPEDGEVGNDG